MARKNTAYPLMFGLLPMVLGTGALAQAQEYGVAPLEEVVVSATKLAKSITDLTQSVTIVDEEAIRLKAYSDFTEVLRSTPGIEFKQAGGPGQFNYPKLRGFATSAILVVIDGVKINEASSGGVSNLLGQIDPNTVERVEILRGPQAVLYGANSTAGVISITTKTGTRSSRGIQLESGSLNWRRAAVSFRDTVDAGNGDFGYSVNFSKIDSDNVNPLEYTKDESVQARFSYDLDRLELGLSYWQTDNEFQSAELDEAYCCQTRETHWAFQTPDPSQFNATKNTVIGANLSHQLADRLSQRFQFGSMDKTYTIIDGADGLLGYQIAPYDNFEFPAFSGSFYQQGDLIEIFDSAASPVASFYVDENQQFDYNLIYQGDSAGFLIGAEFLDQTGRQWGTYGVSDNDESIRSFYVNGELDAGERVVVSLGVRSDDFDSWGRETTGNLGVSIDVGGASSIFANIGTSFTAPTMSQLFHPTYGVPDLMPQSGETAELGWRLSRADGRLQVETTLWHTNLDNVIVYDGAIPNPRTSSGFGQYTNRDRQRTKGAELAGSFAFTEHLSVDGNYTYTDSDNKAAGGDWIRTVQIADNKGNLGLTYQNDGFYVNGNVYYSGPRLRWAGDVEMRSYSRFDLTGRYNFTDTLSGYLRVENLFDEDIEEGLGYRQPGRYSVIGIRYDFM